MENQEPWRLLSIPEMVKLTPNIHWTSYHRKTRKIFFSKVATLDEETLNVLKAKAYRYLRYKADVKEQRGVALHFEEEEDQAQKIESVEVERCQKMSTVATDVDYLVDVGDSHRHELLKDFIAASSNDKTKQGICCSCGGISEACNLAKLPLNAIPDKAVLSPLEAHPAHRLVDGMLLEKKGLVTVEDALHGTFCKECLSHIQEKSMPPLSLANNMWLGEIPFEFEVLTVPERLLISLYYPAVYVYKLYPKSANGTHMNFKHQKLQGNVSTYRLSPQQMAKVVTGDLLPRKPDVLASLISITLVGWKQQPEKTLAGMLRIRRKRVLDALMWAKNNNPFYANVKIDEQALAEIPEDAIPTSLLSSISVVDDIEVVNREMDSYIPPVSEDDAVMDDGTVRASDGCGDHAQRDEEPVIVPLSENAVVDVNGYDIPEEELMWHSIQNVQSGFEDESNMREPRYLYQRGTSYVNEYARRDEEGSVFEGTLDNPNHLLGAFPYLFPYGVGGFEVRRRKPVSYRDHAKWALTYHDGRFAKNMTFIAQVFNVLQKREVCKAAEIQISRKQFKRHEHLFKSITANDLRIASDQETRGERISNKKVRALKRLITATRRNVMGTDEHRQGLRSRIFGTTLLKGPPSLWLTINFADMKEPLVQVFCGENINMDQFGENIGATSEDMSRNATENPYATTKAFYFLMTLFFQELLKIKITSWGHLQRKIGMFGKTAAYMGSIEAQNRGTLHAHLFVWLSGSPTSSRMQELLRDEHFRLRAEKFISENIRSHVDGLDDAYMSTEAPNDITRCKKVASTFSRPLNPDDADFASKFKEFEFCSARIHHMHVCSPDTCKRGKVKCKRGAPWKLSAKTMVLENGEWYTKRKLRWLNTWNPLLMLAFRSNHDIKILTNANGTRDIVWYTTKYASKRQMKAFNMSALLATKYLYNQMQMASAPSLQAANRKMLTQCVNTIGRYQEFSSQQLVALIMGWKDRFESHAFTSIHLRHLMDCLRENFAGLKTQHVSYTSVNDSHRPGGDEIDTDADLALIGDTAAGLRPKSQVSDYINRGERLFNMSFLDFFLESYEPHRSGKPAKPRHERVPYIQTVEGYRDRYRIMRNVRAEIMPDFLGSWPPRNNDPSSYDMYCATMLALLKPWRSWDDLKGQAENWSEAFSEFKARTNERNRFIIENIQFYYDSRDAAYSNKQHSELNGEGSMPVEEKGDMSYEEGDAAFAEDIPMDWEENAGTEIERQSDKPNEMMFGEKAVEIGLQTGVLTYEECPDWKETSTWGTCTTEVAEQVEIWKQMMNATDQGGAEVLLNEIDDEEGDIFVTCEEPEVQVMVDPREDEAGPEIEQVLQSLTDDQRKACVIAKDHLDQVLEGSDEQLFMQIVGSGGVGKSVVIRALEEIFRIKGQRHMLAITATTGIAASHIGGQTIHHWAGLPIRPAPVDGSLPRSSARMKKRRVKHIEPIRFLIIDEISMFTLSNLALLSRYVADVHDPTGVNGGKSFGGKLNVIVVGDYHQFPPPGNNAQLLYLRKPPRENIWAQKGFRIFQEFLTVVLLKKQMRATDPSWAALLERVRTSDTTADDIEVLKSITLTDPSCEVPDFSKPPWSDAVLVTPRHGVRNAWNRAMVAKKAYETKKTILKIKAEEYMGRSKGALPPSAKRDSVKQEQKWKLPYEVEIFEGMKSMITHNVCVDAHLANGTVGTLERIILDPREPPIPKDARTHTLQFLPSVLIFRPDAPPDHQLPNLPRGSLPIQATDVTLSLDVGRRQKKAAHRRQYPITPAYAFTDYKAQAQSLSPLIVDIAKPPSGGLTNFNTYVALSRSRRREHTRILRDFDRKLFALEMNQDLRLFDEHLERMNIEATDRYARGRWQTR